MNPNDFLFREEYYDCISIIDDPRMRLAAWDILLKYGTKGICDFEALSLSKEEQMDLQAVTRQLVISIAYGKERYQKAVANGKKGGRPRKKSEP